MAPDQFSERKSQTNFSVTVDPADEVDSPRSPNWTLLPLLRARSWTRFLVDFIWLASALSFVYFGDLRSNMVALLWADARIRRTALRLGLVTAVFNVGLVLYTCFSWSVPPKAYENYEALASVSPFLVPLGLLSFCLFSYALWPIWSFLTLPLLVTLLMAFIVISSYLLIGLKRPQPVMLRAD